MVTLAPSIFSIKEIHATFIRQYGVDGYVCEGMVSGCLERAMTYIYDFKPFPKLFIKAAAMLYSIITFHPFVDGNKRTAFETTKMFLRLNGYELLTSAEDGVEFTRAIADMKITDIDEITKWLQTHSKRKLSYSFSSFIVKAILLSYHRSTKNQRDTLPKEIIVLATAIRIFPD